jgi:hypothetical protein
MLQTNNLKNWTWLMRILVYEMTLMNCPSCTIEELYLSTIAHDFPNCDKNVDLLELKPC